MGKTVTEAADDHTDPLLADAEHRLVNRLVMLRSVVNLERSSFPPDSAEALPLDRISAQLEAVIRCEALLRQGGDQGGAAALACVCDAMEETVLAPRGILLEARIDAPVPSRVGSILNLVVAELLTNVAKHAVAGPGGLRVRVELTRRRDGLALEVADNGVRAERVCAGSGLGIIERLAARVDGWVAYESGRAGFRATVRLPATGS